MYKLFEISFLWIYNKKKKKKKTKLENFMC